MKSTIIPTLNCYKDWLDKANFELSRYKESSSVYDMANCFLTLNAIPEWVAKSDDVSDYLKNLAVEKIEIMKGNNFILDEYKLSELDHQLRLVRLFCNHSKHANPKGKVKHISMSSTFPLKFPVKFENLEVGEVNTNAIDILRNVIEFWSYEFKIT